MESNHTRLSKVAKEFNVGISTIVVFLRKQGYEIDLNPNFKITPELYDKINKEYGSKIKVIGKIDLTNFQSDTVKVVGKMDLSSIEPKSEICNYINKEFFQLISTSIEYKHLLIDKSIFELIESENLRKNVIIDNSNLFFNPEFENLTFFKHFHVQAIKRNLPLYNVRSLF